MDEKLEALTDSPDLSPMMRKYLETKEEYKDCILFYRLGDFYEMFFEDAETASRELELTLTGKNCGLPERAPMCGVPFHAADTYITRLVGKGYKVAVCEQVENPKEARGLVKREVIKIVTPGTNLDVPSLAADKNNYLFSVAYLSDRIGISVADVSTGDYYLTEVEDIRKLFDEINKYAPSELIANDALLMSGLDFDDLRNRLHIAVYFPDARYFDEDACKRALTAHFKINTIAGLGISDFPVGTVAAGALLQYLTETQKTGLSNLTHLYPYLTNKYMLVDTATRRNLELTETLREKQKRGSLLWVLDKTKTAMGARLLRRYIEQPLIERAEMEERLDAVEELSENNIERDELREYLQAVYDFERLLSKISYRTANARDLIALKNSMEMLPHIKRILSGFHTRALHAVGEEIEELRELYTLLDTGIDDDPPLSVREGRLIKNGFNDTVDELREAKRGGDDWISKLEEEDRERTGIKNLRVKFNNVFGYFFEVTNSYKELVPPDYERKQTLANAERYTTPRLKELEDTILNAEDRLNTLEYELFCEIREKIGAEILRIQKTAKAIAALDVYASLSVVAEKKRYVRPSLNEDGVIEIRDGRHPVVEQVVSGDMFIPNDTYLDCDRHLAAIITGPNMAGKSTYMRQVALIVLMAQIGSFVPAKSANIGITDRIFTRVGASDDLASGQSTFMVEMNEVANILRNATSKSLLILDEIGRGTATFDGLGIAWAVIEHICNRRTLGARTLFATHYHELTELEGKLDNVDNYCIAVRENGDDIIFLRKIVKGGADKSYGIQVAKLAGVPESVTERAKQIVSELSDNDITGRIQEIWNSVSGIERSGQEKNGAYGKRAGQTPAQDARGNAGKAGKPRTYDEVDLAQMSLFDTVNDADVLEELKAIDISTLTPLEALNILNKLQSELNNRWVSG